MNSVKPNEAAVRAESVHYQRHPTYFLDDGSLLIACGTMIYRIHKTLITRHSRAMQELINNGDNDPSHVAVAADIVPDGSAPVCTIPAEMVLGNGDFDALLGHLYHDA